MRPVVMGIDMGSPDGDKSVVCLEYKFYVEMVATLVRAKNAIESSAIAKSQSSSRGSKRGAAEYFELNRNIGELLSRIGEQS